MILTDLPWLSSYRLSCMLVANVWRLELLSLRSPSKSFCGNLTKDLPSQILIRSDCSNLLACRSQYWAILQILCTILLIQLMLLQNEIFDKINKLQHLLVDLLLVMTDGDVDQGCQHPIHHILCLSLAQLDQGLDNDII